MNQLIEIQYFGSIACFVQAVKGKHVIIEQYETYQKMSFRNRCQVLGAGKIINLSVPLLGGRDQKSMITDIEIDDSQSWAMQHWRTLESCYNKSPFFLHYGFQVKEILFAGFRTLWELDLAALKWVLSKLGTGIEVGFTAGYQKKYGDGSLDLRNKIVPANSASFPLEPYQQVFGNGFINNLSILDLLFNLGPQAKDYLLRQEPFGPLIV